MCHAAETTGAGWYRVSKADIMTIPGPHLYRLFFAKVSEVNGESEAMWWLQLVGSLKL